eukprot:331298-Chlamydomonas_euryale.AAC.4
MGCRRSVFAGGSSWGSEQQPWNQSLGEPPWRPEAFKARLPAADALPAVGSCRVNAAGDEDGLY